MNVDELISKKIHDLRKQKGLSLDQLAEQSGVSRSMISLIERGETSPTAAVLNKLAGALNVSLASLFSEEFSMAPSPLARPEDQNVWKDPASGYVRRHLSPNGFSSPLELVEIQFPAGQSVTFENILRASVTHQQVWLLDGEMKITLDGDAWNLKAGDCLAMTLGQRITFENPSNHQARYLVAITTTTLSGRRNA